ncbi:MAG TPA: hypothetical protein VEF06_04100 [Bryobacteraceae bacterium]|nr:hypothetical protein [Bryobacteraceae bacterium]
MKAKKKKPAKAVTLLTKVESLLSDVLDECSVIEKGVEKNVRLLIRAAGASIAAAKEFFAAPPPARPAPRPVKAVKKAVKRVAKRAAAKRPAARARAKGRKPAAPAPAPVAAPVPAGAGQ